MKCLQIIHMWPTLVAPLDESSQLKQKTKIFDCCDKWHAIGKKNCHTFNQSTNLNNNDIAFTKNTPKLTTIKTAPGSSSLRPRGPSGPATPRGRRCRTSCRRRFRTDFQALTSSTSGWTKPCRSRRTSIWQRQVLLPVCPPSSSWPPKSSGRASRPWTSPPWAFAFL